MKKEQDSYGQEVLATLEGKHSYEAVERDDGLLDMSGGSKDYFAEFKDWTEVQKKSIKFAKGKSLDIGCGAGRVGLYLQKKGLKVTSIDNSPAAIEVCKKRGLKDAKVMSIDEINKFKKQEFETIIMFGNNFGLFGSFNKAKKLLKIMHKITSDDALIITESTNPYETKDPIHLSYHRLNRRRGRMPGQLKIRIRFRKYIGEWFDYLFVSEKEMAKILAGTGWKIKKVIKSDKPTYVAVLEKEK